MLPNRAVWVAFTHQLDAGVESPMNKGNLIHKTFIFYTTISMLVWVSPLLFESFGIVESPSVHTFKSKARHSAVENFLCKMGRASLRKCSCAKPFYARPNLHQVPQLPRCYYTFYHARRYYEARIAELPLTTRNRHSRGRTAVRFVPQLVQNRLLTPVTPKTNPFTFS